MVKNYHNLLNLGAFLPKTKQIDVKCKIKKFFGPASSRYSIKPIYKTKKKKNCLLLYFPFPFQILITYRELLFKLLSSKRVQFPV